MSSVDEKALEEEIGGHLVAVGGYRECKVGTEQKWRQDFDAELGLDTDGALRVHRRDSSRTTWEQLVKAHGGDEDARAPEVRTAAGAADR